MNENINKVTSVFPHGSGQKLYFEFFDNDGKKKQKSTGLKDTQANRKIAWKLVPEFEKRLAIEAQDAKDKLTKVKARPLLYYGEKYIASIYNSEHTKAGAHNGRMKTMVEFFGADTLPIDITELDIEEFFEQLVWSRDTKSEYKVVLSAIFEKARKDRALPTNIVKQFTFPDNETQNTSETTRMPFSVEEMRKLIDNADRRLRNFLGIGFHLGLRIEETLGLMIGDIKFDKGTIYLKRAVVGGVVKEITKHKGGPRDVPLFKDALQYIEDQISWAKENNSLYLFFDENGERLNDSGDIRGRCTDKFYWNNYLKELNIFPHRRMMNTRHSFAVHCIRNMDTLGITLNDIASMMGHTSLRMLINHYGKYLADKNKTINRGISIFQESEPSTDYSTDSEVLAK